MKTVDARLVHLTYLADNLRQSDLDELKASSGRSARDALMMAYAVSDVCWVGLNKDDVPIAIWGIAPHGVPEVGVMWNVATDAINDNEQGFLRQSPVAIHKMHSLYPTMFNWVDERNYKSQVWLRWMGFTLTDVNLEYGVEKRPFFKYVRQEYV